MGPAAPPHTMFGRVRRVPSAGSVRIPANYGMPTPSEIPAPGTSTLPGDMPPGVLTSFGYTVWAGAAVGRWVWQIASSRVSPVPYASPAERRTKLSSVEASKRRVGMAFWEC